MSHELERDEGISADELQKHVKALILWIRRRARLEDWAEYPAEMIDAENYLFAEGREKRNASRD